VHSENETDHAKRNVRACTLDLMLDLVPTGTTVVEQHRPQATIEGSEFTFLRSVAATFLNVGRLPHGWERELADS
jgi:putative DNA methylase